MKHAQRIDLAAKFFLGILSRREKRVLEEYLAGCSEVERQAFFNLVDEQKTIGDLHDLYDVSPEYLVGAAGSTRSGGRIASMSRTVVIRRIIGIAAIFLVACGSIVLWKLLQNDDRVKQEPAIVASPTQILPGGNHARLVLANGQVVTLDSAANGSLARQGNVDIVKLANGQLAYHADQTLNPLPDIGYNVLETPVGGQYQVTLPDQTKVWLNSSSSIRYPASFAGNMERRVEVKGEAYLEVAKDAQHPFVVTVGKDEIKVLGTHFNVMAYPEEHVVRTTLLEGSVKVSSKGKSVLLSPGQQAMADSASLAVKKNVDLESVTAWQRGDFAFRGADIETVMRALSRWYGINVIYHSKSDKRITALVSRNNEIKEILGMLELAGFHFTIEKGKTIVVERQ